MCYKNFFRVLALFAFLTGILACTPVLKDESITATGYEQIRNNWTLKNTEVSDGSVSLGSEDATVISKFTVRNFDLKMRLKTTPGAEGKLVFHSPSDNPAPGNGYSVYINNSDYRSGSAQKTGSLSLIRNFFVRMTGDNEWFELGLAVKGNHITVTVNGKIVSEYFEPESPIRLTGLEGMVLSEGKLVLSKSGNRGSILISDIRIDALAEDLVWQDIDFETTDDVAGQLTLLNQEGFPVIDYHGHLKNVISIDEIAGYGRDHGFNYGVSENCGLNFPVTDDESLNAYYQEITGEPVFKAMQCEGREWVNMFSTEYIPQFDYIFTDALTFTDHMGRRMRLWVRSEVHVESEDQFMDMLVEKTLSILSQEPVDIFVNPTFLPAVLDGSYDRLWTTERMDKVIKALVDYDVALEINARYRIPGIEFIRRAKDAGAKFTLGTNNAGEHDLGRLEYCIEVIREVGLTPEDMWFPRPEGQKKVSSMGLPDDVTG